MNISLNNVQNITDSEKFSDKVINKNNQNLNNQNIK